MSATKSDLPLWQTVELIAREKVGRVCIVDNGYPLAFPVNYRFVQDGDGMHIVFRAAPTSALARYEGLASFEVDDIDAGRGVAWSVIARGAVRRVVGEHQLQDPLPALSGRHQWMLLRVTAMSGRRFTGTPNPNSYSVAWQLDDPNPDATPVT